MKKFEKMSQKDFEQLKIGSNINNGPTATFTVLVANCGGPGKYPTHLIKESWGSQNEYYIFHDGEHIRIKDDENKERDGAILGALEI